MEPRQHLPLQSLLEKTTINVFVTAAFLSTSGKGLGGSQDRFGRTLGLVRQGWVLYDQWVVAGAVMSNPGRERLVVPNPRP